MHCIKKNNTYIYLKYLKLKFNINIIFQLIKIK